MASATTTTEGHMVQKRVGERGTALAAKRTVAISVSGVASLAAFAAVTTTTASGMQTDAPGGA